MTWEALLRRCMSCLGSVPNCTIYVEVLGIVAIQSMHHTCPASQLKLKDTKKIIMLAAQIIHDWRVYSINLSLIITSLLYTAAKPTVIDGSDKIGTVVWVADFVCGSIEQSTTQLYCPVHSSMSPYTCIIYITTTFTLDIIVVERAL